MRSIFKINNYKRIYYFKERYNYNSVETSIETELELISTTNYKTIDLDLPLLKVWDTFYFEDEDKIVSIKEVMRTNNNSITYIINSNYEDDLDSKVKAEQLQREFYSKKI